MEKDVNNRRPKKLQQSNYRRQLLPYLRTIQITGRGMPLSTVMEQSTMTTVSSNSAITVNLHTVNLFALPDLTQRIVGGKAAWNGQFPHQVSLQNAKGHFCGASVIHALLLLTAAHCFNKNKAAEVRAVTGAHNLNNYKGSEQFRALRHVIKHENYNKTTLDNDIAILVLKESLVFDNFTKPVDIWEAGATGKRKTSLLCQSICSAFLQLN